MKVLHGVSEVAEMCIRDRNQCIHGIDLLRWMMGNEIDEVYGVTKQQFHHYLEAEDI